MQHRPVNWIENTTRSVEMQFPELQPFCARLMERLAMLLLERLPPQISIQVFDLLPEDVKKKLKSLESSASSEMDSSISYTDFVERTMHMLGCSEIVETDTSIMELSERIADKFLWTVTQELPPEIKIRMFEALPMELRSRMDLFSAQAESSQVA